MEDEQIVFTKEDAFVTENEDLNYKLSWVIPNAQKFNGTNSC